MEEKELEVNLADNLGVLATICWFSMDVAWKTQSNTLALSLIAPTLIFGILLIWQVEEIEDKLSNAAALCWSAMNSFWMSSEILSKPGLMLGADIAQDLGLALIVIAIAKSPSPRLIFRNIKRVRFTVRIKERVKQ